MTLTFLSCVYVSEDEVCYCVFVGTLSAKTILVMSNYQCTLCVDFHVLNSVCLIAMVP